jgi:hypothetical protein
MAPISQVLGWNNTYILYEEGTSSEHLRDDRRRFGLQLFQHADFLVGKIG